jgi:hypothetical protein
MPFCVSRNCRNAGLKGLTGLCRTHFGVYVEAAAKKPTVLGTNYKLAECYLCGRTVQFSFGLYETHNDEVGVLCGASGHEIAVLKAQ